MQKIRYTSLTWGLLLVITILTIISMDYLMSSLSKERFFLSYSNETIELSEKIVNNIEELSKSSRKYVITKKNTALEKYNDLLNRHISLKNSLKKMQNKEIYLAYKLSKTIIKIQQSAIELVNQANTDKEAAINLIFSDRYDNMLLAARTRILIFKNELQTKLTKEIQLAATHTGKYALYLAILSSTALLLIIGIFLMRKSKKTI